MSTTTSTGSTRPDIFITGVMKGGTTILHDYICTHSDVVAGSLKEIHYFSLSYDKGPDWYDEHFRDVPAGKRTIDASPTYFDVANTALLPKLIRAYTADPRVLLITRDPIERAISHFTHLQKVNKVACLEGMQADEFFSHSFGQAYGQTDDVLMYLNLVLSFSFYYRRFVTYRQQFEANQFLVLDNNNLRTDPKAVMGRVFDFLDLDYQHHKSFGVVSYSNGSSLGHISSQTYHRLAELFYPDYEKYCHQAGITFVEAGPVSRAA
jgi:hypothetical protein